MPAARKAAAVCYRLNPAGEPEFLLIRNKDGTQWVFPKGTMEGWEAFGYQTAVRETWEEAGIRIPATECVARLPAGTHTDFEFVELHVAHHSGPIKCPPEEVACGEWFAPGDIADWVAARPQDFAKGFVTCWKAYWKP